MAVELTTQIPQETAIIILVQDVIMDTVEVAQIALQIIVVQTLLIVRIVLGIGLMVIQIQARIHQGQIVHKVLQLHHHLGEEIHQVVAHQEVVHLVAAGAEAHVDQDRLTKY